MRSPILCLSAALLAFTPAWGQAVPAQSVPDRPAAGSATVAPQTPLLTEGPLLERKGDVLMVRKLYREAVETYSRALVLEPKNAVVCNKLGIAYHQQFQFGAARNSYQRALRLNKSYAEAISNLGTIFYAQKNHKKAIRMYEKALAINPDSASIYSNLGTAWFARKKYEEAFDAYRKALALDPEVFEHRSSYGVLLQERSVEDRARFHFFLARTYAAAGNSDRALEYLRKALEEGFKETQKIYEDPVFAELVKMPQFAELMANPPTALPQ